MSEMRDRVILAEQRAAIVAKIEDAALNILADANADPEGAPLVAACLEQAADIARWAIYDPTADAAS